MQKQLTKLFFAGFLLVLNFLAWQEIFELNQTAYLKVDFLDVGQGDAAFIETPENHQILIDGGPDSSALKKVSLLMPFWDRNLDLVILTHPEKDHMQGLIDILRRYKADYILWTGVKRQSPEYEAWLNILSEQKENGAKIIIAKAGQRLKAGDVLIDTLYPFQDIEGQELKDTSNDAGAVLKLIFGKNSFLFTGDISSKAEKNIVASKELFSSEVLKVAHHGSKYSTSDLFLANLGATVSVISAGKDNSYGHPAEEVLQRLENFGIQIKRTDQSGDVIFLSDGKNIITK